MLEPKSSGTRFIHEVRVPSSRHESGMWLHWFVRLRWVAVAAQAIVIATMVDVIHMPAVVVPVMIVLMGVLAIANARAQVTLDRGATVDDTTLMLHVGLDVVVLTGLLLLSGGAANPFAILLVVHVTMAAMMLRPTSAVAVAGLVLGAWTLLQVAGLPLHMDRYDLLDEGTLAALGRFLALAVTVTTVLVFTLGMANSLRRRERQLRAARARLGQPNTEEVPHPATIPSGDWVADT